MFNTERPTKRARISGPWDSNVGDIAPEIDVNAARQANDLRLKSRFEDIFEKYGKDFSSVGDEIDLATGKIIIDNGHIEKMRNEQDLGAQTWKYDFDPLGELGLIENADEVPNAPNLKCIDQNGKHAEMEEIHLGNNMGLEFPSKNSSHNPEPPCGNCTPFEGSLPLKDIFLLGSPTDIDKRRLRTSSHSVAPLWQTPEIDERLFGSSPVPIPPSIFPRNRTASPPNSGSLWALPQIRRKKTSRTSGGRPRGARKVQLLPRPIGSGHISDSDSDDPLQNSLPPLSTPPRINILDEAKNVIEQPPASAEEPRRPPGPFSQSPDFGLSRDEANDQQAEDANPETSSQNHAKRNSERSVESPLLQANNTIENEIPAIPENDISLAERESITQISIAAKPAKPSTEAGPFTPNEIKTILTLRAVQKRPWKEVYRAVPNRTSGQLRHWYYVRSIDIKNCPPPQIHMVAKEKDALEAFKSKPEASWEDLETAFEGQTRNELQCKWAKICLGEMWEDWKGSHCLPTQRRDGNFKTQPKSPKRPLTSKSPSPTKLSQTAQTASPSRTPRTPSFVSVEPPEQGDEGSDSDDPLSEAFNIAWSGSGLSTIQIDTPPKAHSLQKRQSLLKAKVSPWANRTLKNQSDST
ncbi:hypothetical protein EMCG_00363 [[Emmonsia] crescens]|uniref:Myb-like domain-containing protein n=1 Tax=[Emmonsia] crescens TaxID=73230 RepID=A0A0G2HXZ6_9EURO|nr:hypothetical protein EMCG_00363 [Emmonsia crescens UAMH 3008]